MLTHDDLPGLWPLTRGMAWNVDKLISTTIFSTFQPACQKGAAEDLSQASKKAAARQVARALRNAPLTIARYGTVSSYSSG